MSEADWSSVSREELIDEVVDTRRRLLRSNQHACRLQAAVDAAVEMRKTLWRDSPSVKKFDRTVQELERANNPSK